jgi:hypothetical protein
MNNNNNLEMPFNNDGSKNPRYVDVLDEDKPISGQKFVCISFISPENIIKDKNMFFFEKFLNQWDLNKSLQKYRQFLNYLSFKFDLDFDTLNSELETFCLEERDNLFTTDLYGEYKTYLDNNETKLTEEYDSDNKFQTSTRGIKVRGSYPTQQEAELRCRMLREIDPTHDVYVGPVGVWMPFHPEAYKTGRVEYLEPELNQLMHEKNKNESQAKQEFDKRVLESKKKAIEENKKKALETGNLLTQTMDEKGNLVSVKDINTFDNELGENVAVSDIRKELFHSDDVARKGNDHGLSMLSNTNIKLNVEDVSNN